MTKTFKTVVTSRSLQEGEPEFVDIRFFDGITSRPVLFDQDITVERIDEYSQLFFNQSVRDRLESDWKLVDVELTIQSAE